MKFFKPEDFEIPAPQHKVGSLAQQVADTANAKLEREGKVVYGYEGLWGETDAAAIYEEAFPRKGFVPINIGGYKTTHKGLLINIEPIEEQCKHEANKVFKFSEKTESGIYTVTRNYQYQCECGARVKPKEFEEVK